MTSPAAIPGEQDIIGLPYFAILALGARCARRVAPLFRLWEQAPDEYVRAVSDAIQAVEDLAGCPDAVSRAPFWITAADATLHAAEAASAADHASAPASALGAADAAAELADAIEPDCSRGSAARAVYKSIWASANALEQHDAGSGQVFRAQLAEDFERLRLRASQEGWDDETGIQILDS